MSLSRLMLIADCFARVSKPIRMDGPLFCRRRAERSNAPRCGSCSTLRKTFGYWAYQFGVDVRRIQNLFNHSTPSITLAYIGIMQEELDNVYLRWSCEIKFDPQNNTGPHEMVA